ncbi:GH25 family lysozyme, partial [Vagococcus sp. PNs007]
MNDGYNYKKICLALASLIVIGIGNTAYAEYEPANSDFIDISNHQKDLQQSFFNGLPKQGVSGIALKVSEGNYYIDAYARNNIARARAAGVKVSAYHFSHFETEAEAKVEAAFFDKLLVQSGFNKSQDGYVVLDIENPNSVSPENLTRAANIFVNELKAKGYPRIDIYVGDYYLRSELIASQLVVKDPWIAAYPDYPDQHISSVAHKGGMGAWQFADNGWIDGYDGILDVSVDYSGKYTASSGSIYYEGQAIKGSKKISVSGLDIYDRPGPTAHSKVIDNTKNYLNKKVDFTKQVKTDKGLFKQFEFNGKVIGFVSDKAFSDFVTIVKKTPVDYQATIHSTDDGVRTLPYGMENSELIVMTSEIVNQEFHITEELEVSSGSTWLRLEKDGKFVGYVDKSATVAFVTMTETPVNYGVKVISTTDGIRTLPYGMRHSDLIEMTSKV